MVPDLATGEELDERCGRYTTKDGPHHDDECDGWKVEQRVSFSATTKDPEPGMHADLGRRRGEYTRLRRRTQRERYIDKLDLLEHCRGVTKLPQNYANSHGEEDPQGEELVEKF